MKLSVPSTVYGPALVSVRVAAIALAVAAVGGCMHKASPQPLTSRSFYGSGSVANAAPVTGERRITEDQVGENARVQPTAGVQIPAGKQLPKAPTTQPAGPASAAKRPKNESFAGGVTASSGQYQVLGTVVAVVNNTPIYATNVLTPLSKIFAQRARELGPMEFRDFVSRQVHDRLEELLHDEVLFAAAQRGLSDEDQKLAESITLKWRMDQMTHAGGSIEIARSRAAAEGDDFDELCRQQYRRNMIEVYNYKKITPRIQVTSNDLRRYYEKHKEDEFTEHASARFRLLEVSKEKSAELALDKIAKKLQRAKAGEDFKAMCTAENDDAMLASIGGDLGWKDKGSLPPALAKVEEAVWSLKPGQFTDVIQAGKAYYVAQLVDVHPGLVRPFNEQPSGNKPSVQEEIDGKLRKEQFRELSADINDKLVKDAVWTTDKDKFELCVDMAMQRYPAWREAGVSKAD